MKKTLAFLLGLILMVGTISACSNSPTTSTTIAPVSTTTAISSTTALMTTAASTAPAKATTINVWCNNAADKVEWDQTIKKFNETNTKGITIVYNVYGSDWQTVIDTAIAAGSEPEIYKSAKTKQYVDMGKLLPLNELTGIDDVLKANEKFQTNNLTMFGGKVYSIPFHRTAFAMIYNTDLLTKAGFSAPPATWADMVKIAKAESEVSPGKVYGTAMPCKYTNYHDSYIMTSAVPSIGHFQFDAADGKYKFADLLPYFNELILPIIKNGSLFPGAGTLDNDTLRAQFAEGNIGMYFAGSYDVGVLYDQFPAKVKWAVAPMPVRDASKKFNNVLTPGSLFVVDVKVKTQGLLSQAGEVLRLFDSKELLQLLYTNGKDIAINPETITGAPESSRPQWNDFVKLSANSVMRAPFPESLFAVEGDTYYTVFTKIIAGQADPATALADLDTRYTAALNKAVAAGTIKLSDFINPAYDDAFIIK